MTINTLNKFIHNSSWITSDKKLVYKFANGRDLWINGKKHKYYSINLDKNKVVIDIDGRGKYYIEYINDFKLSLYNEKERFIILPESN